MKETPPKKISHIGIAVKDLDGAIRWYKDVLGLPFEGIETIENQQVRVAFFLIGESRIELLEPLSDKSPIARFLIKRGEGLHHIALEVRELSTRLQSLSSRGVQLLDELPKRGAHQCNIAFLHPKSTNGVLIELCEPICSDEKG